MTALKGTATFRRFFIGGQPQKGFREKALRSINARRFMPTKDAEGVAFGWVPLTDALADHLGPEDVFVGELVCLGFRRDEKVLRAADVRDELKLRVRELQFEKGRRLSRDERAALKDAIVFELRARAPIRRKVAELVWNPEKAEVRLYGASKQMAQACGELFARTFELAMEESEVAGLMVRLGVDLATLKGDTVPLSGPIASVTMPARELEAAHG
ncbi:MAG: recombination-associated protein RdgC [Myxococcota bacterium]